MAEGVILFKDPRWENPVHHGYMIKRGSFVKNWKNRFFILTRDGKLWYFKNEKSRVPLKKKPIRVRDMKFCSSTRKKFCIAIEVNKRTSFFFYADSEEKKLEWIRQLSLCGGIKCPEDFKPSLNIGNPNEETERNNSEDIPGVFDLNYEGGRYLVRVKVTLLGESAVGKSCILLRCIRKQFFEYQESTIGAAFLNKNKYLNYFGSNFMIKMEIWDTAGQERYKSLAPMYYRGSGIILIVYDVTSNESYLRAKAWVKECQRQGPSGACIFLIGNKVDLFNPMEKKHVQIEDVRSYCKDDVKIPFLGHVSAKTGLGIKEGFDTMRTTYLEKKLQGMGIKPDELRKGSLEDLSEERKRLDKLEFNQGDEGMEQSTINIKNPVIETEEKVENMGNDEGLKKMEVLMKGAIAKSSQKTVHQISWRSVVSQKLVRCTFQIVSGSSQEEENNNIINNNLDYIEVVSGRQNKKNIYRYRKESIEKIVISNRLQRFMIQLKKNEDEQDEKINSQLIFQCLKGSKEEEEQYRNLCHEIQVIFLDFVETESEEEEEEEAEHHSFLIDISETYNLLCLHNHLKPLKEVITLLSKLPFRFELSNYEKEILLDNKTNRKIHLPLLFSSLGWSSTIRFLNLSGLDLQPKELSIFWKECLLNNSRQITHIRLDDLPALPKVMGLLAQTYSEGGRGICLESLSLRNCGLVDADIKPLFVSLVDEKCLQHLDLSNNQLTDMVNPELEKLCANQNSLTEIDLESNNFQEDIPKSKNKRIQMNYKGNPCYNIQKEDFISTTDSGGLSPEEYRLEEDQIVPRDVIYTGMGGATKIIRAEWWGCSVVVKQISVFNRFMKEMMKKEAFLGIGLAHPCVIGTYGWFEGPKSVSIVLEAMDTDLAHVLHKKSIMKRRFRWKDKLRIIRNIVGGMMYLHGKNIVHLDLKPGNVLCSRDYRFVKITDFGFSEQKTLDVSSFNSSTTRGTSFYVAPESFLNDSYGKSSDIYSFGIMLYEIVFSKIPFFEQEFKTPNEAAEKISKESLRPFLDRKMIGDFVEDENKHMLEDVGEEEEEVVDVEEEEVVRMVELMQWCWKHNKTDRPTFQQIYEDYFSMKKNM